MREFNLKNTYTVTMTAKESDFVNYRSPLTVASTSNCRVFSFVFFRRRFPQLPSHIPLWLCHEWVWLEAQCHHCLYWSHVFPGFGPGPQEGVEGNHHRSRSANRWWQRQKWLSHKLQPQPATSYKLCNWCWGVKTRRERSNRYSIFRCWGGDYHASDYNLNLFLRLILALKSCRNCVDLFFKFWSIITDY